MNRETFDIQALPKDSFNPSHVPAPSGHDLSFEEIMMFRDLVQLPASYKWSITRRIHIDCSRCGAYTGYHDIPFNEKPYINPFQDGPDATLDMQQVVSYCRCGRQTGTAYHDIVRSY